MRSEELDFHLPPDLIAQTPSAQRSASRLLHYRSADASISHRTFSDLPALLKRGDLLVFNDSRVIPARFTLRKSTGGRVEGLFIALEPDGAWRVMLKNPGPVKHDLPLSFLDAPDVSASVTDKLEDGEYLLRVGSPMPAMHLLSRMGRMPLPPYIKRAKDHDPLDESDRERYQTVYAKDEGSVAAPTAGLHFTPEILSQLEQRGIERVFLTLHVGLGTFKPVAVDDLSMHWMHSETYSISATAAERLNAAKQEGRRIIAVGTTSARVLESQPDRFTAREDATQIFIYPPYQWKHVDALITNFHLPRSTLIALVAAKVGLEQQRCIYRESIDHKYRFFSYGDSSFLE